MTDKPSQFTEQYFINLAQLFSGGRPNDGWGKVEAGFRAAASQARELTAANEKVRVLREAISKAHCLRYHAYPVLTHDHNR